MFVNVFVIGLLCQFIPTECTSELQVLIDEFFDWRLAEWPGYGTRYGVSQHDDKLQPLTEAAFTQQKLKAEEFLQRCELINDDTLTSHENISLAVLKDLLKYFIDGFAFRKYGIYNMALPSYNSMLTNMKKNNEEDYQKILARYRLISQRIDDMIELMKIAVKDGTTLYSKQTHYMSSMLHMIGENANNTDLYRPFEESEMPVVIEEPLRSKMQSEALRLISEKIIPAVENYKAYIDTEYKTRPKPGASSLPGGLNYYKACLKWHLTTDISPEEIHQLGHREVERISKKMVEIMEAEGFQGTLNEYKEHLQQDSNNFYNTSEEVLQGYRDIIKANHERLQKVLLEVPKIPIVVIRGHGPRGAYSNPPLDSSAPGIFIANVDYPDELAKHQMMAITLHEAEPGHHTQVTYAFQQDIPKFRKLLKSGSFGAVPFNWLFYTVYIEGWALYAESLGEEMGSYSEPHTLFGKYDLEMYRAARLVVDTGIHAFGWSIDKSEVYLRNHTNLGDTFIQFEVERYIAVPGQACAYKIGELKIRELREKAEALLGKAFDLREFHYEILRIGPVSLSILEEQIMRWINESIKSVTASSAGKTMNNIKLTVALISMMYYRLMFTMS